MKTALVRSAPAKLHSGNRAAVLQIELRFAPASEAPPIVPSMILVATALAPVKMGLTNSQFAMAARDQSQDVKSHPVPLHWFRTALEKSAPPARNPSS